MSWAIYWNKKNIWTDSEIWKKDIEFLYKKTSDIFNYNKKHMVLDIGCGNGDFAKKISNKVDQIYCLDMSQEFINLCKINVANRNNVKVLKPAPVTMPEFITTEPFSQLKTGKKTMQVQ